MDGNDGTQDSAQHNENDAQRRALAFDQVPPAIADARDRQDALLLERLRRLREETGRPLHMADIGCGHGYHAAHLREVLARYDGFEIAPEIAGLAHANWRDNNIDFASLHLGDVADPAFADHIIRPQTFDVVACLYFTTGNLREKLPHLHDYDDRLLDRNPGLVSILRRFRDALKQHGRCFLCVYEDTPEAADAQRAFYIATGQTVVTNRESRFTATREGFWSLRFKEPVLRRNLDAAGYDGAAAVFHRLNAIAWLVEARPAPDAGADAADRPLTGPLPGPQ